MCAGTDCSCNLQIPRGPRGLQGIPGAAPNFTVNTSTLPAGQPASATVTGTSPNLTLNLAIPQGAQGPAGQGTPGVDGIPAFAPLLAGFTQPAVNSTVTITTNGSFRWAVQGESIFVGGGGYYTVATQPVSPFTSLTIRNVGGAGNATPGTAVTPNGAQAQVTPSGPPGPTGNPGTNGLPGAAGASGVIRVVTTIPTTAPLPGQSFVIYTDNPTTPTVVTGYSWNGSAWVASVNLTPVAGTLTIFVNGDPNTLLPAGPVGTIAIRTDQVSQIDYYIKSTPSSWTLQDSITISNTITQTVVAGSNLINGQALSTNRVVGDVPFLEVAPPAGLYTLRAQYGTTHIQIDKPIELNWESVSYSGHATHILYLENIDLSSKAITYTTGRWARNPAATLPSTLAVGATQVFVMRFNAARTRMIIEHTYVVTNV